MVLRRGIILESEFILTEVVGIVNWIPIEYDLLFRGNLCILIN